MKKTAALLILALCLTLCAGFALPAAAEAGNAPEGNKLALDMVILVDISDTMKTNDSNFYRLEAAAMIIGMCDYENSRIALVPFGTDVYTNPKIHLAALYSDRLYNLTEASSFESKKGIVTGTVRDCITSLLVDTDNRVREEYGGATALGAALKYGVNLLKPTAKDSGNQKVVVLLTDGKIDLPTAGGISGQQLMQEDTQKFNAAYQQAKDYGVKVYTVALKEKDVKLLRDASKATGAPETKVVDNAEDLPDVFNSFLSLENPTLGVGFGIA